jgi:hypothetical protein
VCLLAFDGAIQLQATVGEVNAIDVLQTAEPL